MRPLAILLLLLPLSAIAAEEASLPSEKDYLSEMPISKPVPPEEFEALLARTREPSSGI